MYPGAITHPERATLIKSLFMSLKAWWKRGFHWRHFVMKYLNEALKRTPSAQIMFHLITRGFYFRSKQKRRMAIFSSRPLVKLLCVTFHGQWYNSQITDHTASTPVGCTFASLLMIKGFICKINWVCIGTVFRYLKTKITGDLNIYGFFRNCQNLSIA